MPSSERHEKIITLEASTFAEGGTVKDGRYARRVLPSRSELAIHPSARRYLDLSFP
jgi:hypothetical protein